MASRPSAESGPREDNRLALAQRSADAMYRSDMASRALGIAISDVAPGRATATMTIGPAMVNGHGIAHGGYVFLLADTAFAFACNTDGRATVAAAAEVVFIQAVQAGDELTAVASERVRHGRSGIYDVTVTRASAERSNAEVIAEFRGHSRVLR